MEKNFASSSVMRQNVLNNQLAVAEIQKAVGIKGILFENEYKFVKKQIADFFEVTERTIELCLEKHARELERNGYEVLRGKRLMDFKLVVQNSVGAEIDFGTKTTVLGIYNFRTLLNIAMLLTDSQKAMQLRSTIWTLSLIPSTSVRVEAPSTSTNETKTLSTTYLGVKIIAKSLLML